MRLQTAWSASKWPNKSAKSAKEMSIWPIYLPCEIGHFEIGSFCIFSSDLDQCHFQNGLHALSRGLCLSQPLYAIFKLPRFGDFSFLSSKIMNHNPVTNRTLNTTSNILCFAANILKLSIHNFEFNFFLFHKLVDASRITKNFKIRLGMCLQYIIHRFHFSLESHIWFDFLTGWFKKGFEGIRISFLHLLSHPLHAICMSRKSDVS